VNHGFIGTKVNFRKVEFFLTKMSQWKDRTHPEKYLEAGKYWMVKMVKRRQVVDQEVKVAPRVAIYEVQLSVQIFQPMH
jgi:hypothetical protein